MLGLVQTFRKLFQNPVRSRLNTQEKRRLEVELLEDRCLLSGNVALLTQIVGGEPARAAGLEWKTATVAYPLPLPSEPV